MNQEQREIKIISFKDKNALHIVAMVVRLGMKISGKPTFNHTAILYENKNANQYIYEIRGSGSKINSLTKKISEYRGELHIHTLSEVKIPHEYDIYSVFESLFDFEYSATEALASLSFKGKLLQYLNKLLKKLSNPNNTKTYCSATLKCLEQLEVDLNIKISLLEEIRQNYPNFESITPGDVYLICQKLYGDSLEVIVCK